MGKWKNVWKGIKAGLTVAVALNEAGVIKVKELKKIPVKETIKEIEETMKGND